jgi:hypothetical protein
MKHMKTIAALVAALAALGLPGAALGKGRNTVQVCGPEACVTLEDRAGARYIGSPQEGVFEPPRPSPYYRLYVTVEGGTYRHTYSGIYAPSTALIGVDEGARRVLYWHVPATETLQELRVATRELEAYDAPSEWPLAVGDLPAAETGRDRDSFDLAPVAILLTLAAGAIVVRRAQVSPRTG